MIVVIGLDLDLVGLIRDVFPDKKIGFIDIFNHETDIEYLGTDDVIPRLILEGAHTFVFGTDRIDVKSRIMALQGIQIISVISNKINCGAKVKIGNGVIIQDLCYISESARIGNFSKVNVGAQIHHEVQVGDNSTVAPKACLLGKVKVGQRTLIGSGAIILPNLEIGNDCIVAAGSVVTKNVPSGSRVKGNPAKIF
jgi:sugar O-acyltransferase (sialic acid O-acetyltransferase NeuD family)